MEKSQSSVSFKHDSNLELIIGDVMDISVKEYQDIDTVFHLAAKIGGIKYFHDYPATILRANAALTHKVLDNCVSAGVNRIVYVSSSMVFERATKYPTPEDHIEECPPPLTAYGFSKLAGEIACKSYYEEYELPYIICRPFNAYGNGELPEDDPGMAHVIPDFIKKMSLEPKELPIFGDGLQTRCYTHVDDVADGIYTAGTGMRINEAYNISSDVETTVKDLAAMMWEMMGNHRKLKFKHLPSFEYDVKRRIPDTSKIKNQFDWVAKTSLADGLKRTYEWHISNLVE